ncbi:MAG: type II toxin-antitoxin system PemK/MazF family toxin [Rhodoferax sp.]|nr:type II toxin-antitoxin system PemK/MazF family toxin [Rhodoferax sp.]
MALPYFPRRGEVLICDFDSGFRAPEMVKKRPAVVISIKESHNRRLCTVVPFSTTQPNAIRGWHHPLSHVKVPGLAAADFMWAKCDMLATVSFERLNKPYFKTRGGRRFMELVLDDEDMLAIDNCLRLYLSL